MIIKNIVALINSNLAGEILGYNELKQFMDRTIDDINEKLNSTYPAFSELTGYDTDYNMFPEKYIRTVVVPGASWYFYVMDEEGTPTAQQFQLDYNRGLMLMQRDMLYNVPLEYQADSLQGTVSMPYEMNSRDEINFNVGEW